MIISKAKAQHAAKAAKAQTEKPPPDAFELLANRDYVGAITVLKYKQQAHKADPKLQEWLAYAHFHYGEHDKALALYQELLRGEDPDPLYWTYSAACSFYMGLYQQAEQQVLQGPRCPLQARLLFHLAAKAGDEPAIMQRHQGLGDGLEDSLSLASVHYTRGHYQEATDIYKRLLLENRDYTALNVYVALCYAKLDYYDVSKEILDAYLAAFPLSPLALNLKACNTFRLFNGKAAEGELKGLADAMGGKHTEHTLLRHNLVVFRGGEGAVQVLGGLTGDLPEARVNLVIHHLRRGEVGEAYDLTRDLEPATPQEYIVKALVHTCLGQSGAAGDHLKQGQQYFQLVGSSSSECDTIPGRQAMASCFFLLKQFDDVLIFLESIKSYFPNDDDFHWNLGIALAAAGRHKDAEEVLGTVASDKYRSEYCWVSWLARCYIAQGRPRLAWQQYLALDGSEDAYQLLLLIANDCYRLGHFYYALKAFDVLERLDPNPEFWDAKRGAAVGVFQMVIAGKEQVDKLREVLEVLRSSAAAAAAGPNKVAGQQLEQVVRVMAAWAHANGVPT